MVKSKCDDDDRYNLQKPVNSETLWPLVKANIAWARLHNNISLYFKVFVNVLQPKITFKMTIAILAKY